MSPAASNVTSLSAVSATAPAADCTPSLINRSAATPFALIVIVPAATVDTAFVTTPPLSIVIVPPALSVMLPAVACCASNTVTAFVSTMSMLPLVELSMSRLPASVSIAAFAPAPAVEPTPVTALITTRPLAASIFSTPVSPLSITPPLVVLIVTAAIVALLVNKRPKLIFSSAFRAIVPLPALIKVPSTIVNAPLTPSPTASASAVTATLPLVLVMSPAAANVTSSSARNVMDPLTLVTVSFTTKSPAAAPSANRLIVPAPTVLTPLCPAATVTVPVVEVRMMLPAVVCASWLMATPFAS